MPRTNKRVNFKSKTNKSATKINKVFAGGSSISFKSLLPRRI